MLAAVSLTSVPGSESHCASSFLLLGGHRCVLILAGSHDWSSSFALLFSKHLPSPCLSNEFSLALLRLGWFVSIVGNKMELAKEIEKLTGEPRKKTFFWKPEKRVCFKKKGPEASLVAQWLRIRLPMQGIWVQALVQEDPTCHGATKPVRHNY